jgi:bile acid:Na+ symporter, BASS family
MKFLLPCAVSMLMISIGMSLNARDLLANWRRLTWTNWALLLLATFILPPVLILLLVRMIPIQPEEQIGLFMVAVAPGAPLLTRNIAKKGFDMQLAASYQVWGAMLTPIMIPLVVAATGKLYDRVIWISPLLLLKQIAEKQFVPLLAGMLLMRFVPVLSRKLETGFNFLGNAILTLFMIVILFKMGPALRQVTPWVFAAAGLLALGCMAVMFLLRLNNRKVGFTLALSNANRHAGLALLLSTQYLHHRDALPAVAAYAVMAAALMMLTARFARTPTNRDQATLAPAA